MAFVIQYNGQKNKGNSSIYIYTYIYTEIYTFT